MSVPPQIIQVKRKRNDDGPVAFLRIEQSIKRHRSGAFLYQRHDPEAALEGVAAAQQRDLAGPPVIHVSRPGDENLSTAALKRSRAAAAETAQAPALAGSAPGSDGEPAPSAAPHVAQGGHEPASPQPSHSATKTAATEPRRFHLSRNSLYSSDRNSVLGSRVTKVPHANSRGASPALFVERSKRKRPRDETAPLTPSGKQTSRPGSASRTAKALSPAADTPAEGGPAVSETLLPLRPKLPLPRRGGAATASARDSAPPKLPDAFMNRQDADMDRLAREMEEYTLQCIAQDLEKIKAQDAVASARQRSRAAAASTTSPAARSPSGVKFKPRAPAKRYAERHPEVSAAAAHSGDVEMDDGDKSDSDAEADYVIDTYVRITADSVGSDLAPEKIGLLVLDNDPDVDYFYGEESESEEEFEDDEDENAENYYTADYPDDEVASDDEFDRNPYLFRNGNASDLEEFESGGDDGDDDDDDRRLEADSMDDGAGIGDRFRVTIGRQPLPRF